MEGKMKEYMKQNTIYIHINKRSTIQKKYITRDMNPTLKKFRETGKQVEIKANRN